MTYNRNPTNFYPRRTKSTESDSALVNINQVHIETLFLVLPVFVFSYFLCINLCCNGLLFGRVVQQLLIICSFQRSCRLLPLHLIFLDKQKILRAEGSCTTTAIMSGTLPLPFPLALLENVRMGTNETKGYRTIFPVFL